MPVINGRFYANPAYGRGMERARLREEGAENDELEVVSAAEANGANGHWVTMDHRHILIHESTDRNAHDSSREGGPANVSRRARIAEIARRHVGDTSMPYTTGHPTCNLFVQRTVAESGAPKPVMKKADGTWGAPSAAEWANSPIPGWRFLKPGETPQPGDVAARKENFVDATGHSGIVVAVDPNGVVTAIAAHYAAIGKDMSFQISSPTDRNRNVFRRYIGE